MLDLKSMMIWFLIFELTQCAVLKISKEDRTHQVGFKRIGNYATDVHFDHIRILVNFSKVINTPVKAMSTKETYIQNVYQQYLMYSKDQQRGNIADKHQSHLVAQLIKETSDYILALLQTN
jgi:hypothetical protein